MSTQSIKRTLVGFAATAAAVIGLFAATAGTANASTSADANGKTPAATISATTTVSKAALLREVARIKASGPRAAAALQSVWSADAHSNTWNGGCAASAHTDYYPANDQALMSTTVRSPYLFAACRVRAQLWIDTRAGSFPSATNYAVACAVSDPTCASTQTTNGNYYGATSALTAFVASVNDALNNAGLPPTYTRAMAVTGTHITFSNAS